jgi:hypothetical protein
MQPWRGSYRKWTTRYSDGCCESAGLRAAGDGHAVCRPWASHAAHQNRACCAPFQTIESVWAACAADLLSGFAKGLLRFHCV